MTRFGLLLPHFGEHADPALLFRGARRAEELGFDSLWVRDHLVFHPHGMEGSDRTFIEPMTTLAFVAGSTQRIGLGTATVIPHRHPIHLAQLVASLARLLGGRSLDIGVGAGNFQHEFDVIGLGDEDRPDLMREHIEIMRELWTGQAVNHHSDRYQFEDVDLHPAPGRTLPIWWGGGTPASTRMAVDYCDGWLPGRITFATYEVRVGQIREREAQRERAATLVGAVPITSVGRSRHEAMAHLDPDALIKNANAQRFWVRPESGEFSDLQDIEGSLLAGGPDDIISGVQRYQEIGCDLLIFDLRLRFADWVEQIEMLSSDVLPRVGQGETESVSVTSDAPAEAHPGADANELRSAARAVALERGWDPDDELIDAAVGRYRELAAALRPMRAAWLGKQRRGPQ